MSKKNLQQLIEKSIDNIDSDRAAANKLLTDLIIYMAKTGDTSHQSMGHVAAQYLETLQRSNEQLVKITSIIQRQEGNNKGISEIEKNDIYDVIREGK
jgi:hypothetical protein